MLALGVLMSSSVAAHAKKEKLTEIYWKTAFVHASDEYLDQVYFANQPTQGTLAGYHQYDTKLEDPSRTAIRSEIASLEKFERRFEGMRRKASFDPTTRGDCDIVLGNIRSRLLTSADNSLLGEGSRLLLHAPDQRRIQHHGAQICFARRPPPFAGRT